jgi:cyanophycin synthetase
MNLLRQGALEAGAAPAEIHLVPGEPESTAAALGMAKPGDLVVVTPTDVFAAWQQVVDFERVESATSPRGHLIAAE